ncbi:MAG: hypothetical protein Q9179_004206 [Wetmoreana sp. 5 TL-2023]
MVQGADTMNFDSSNRDQHLGSCMIDGLGHGDFEAMALPEVNLATLEPEENEPEEKAPRRVTGIAWFIIVVAVISATFLFSLNTTIIADIQPAVVENFGHIKILP